MCDQHRERSGNNPPQVNLGPKRLGITQTGSAWQGGDLVLYVADKRGSLATPISGAFEPFRMGGPPGFKNQ